MWKEEEISKRKLVLLPFLLVTSALLHIVCHLIDEARQILAHEIVVVI